MSLAKHPATNIALFLIMVASAAFAFVLLRGQDRNWDLLNYHFFTGYSLLNGRLDEDIAAANLQSFFNPLANVFSYLAISKLPFPFSAWAILCVQLLALPALVMVAREIGKALNYPKFSITEAAVLVICVLSPLWWSELGTSFFSSTTAPLLLFGLYFVLREGYGEASVSYGVKLSGLMFGLAVGLKLTNAPFAVAATASLIYAVSPMGWRVGIGRLAGFLLFGLIGFGCTAWWNWYLWTDWNSPIFPMYNSIFKSPYADFSSMRDMRWYFAGIQDFLNYIVESAFGTSKTSEIAFADSRLITLCLLVPSAFIVGREKENTDRRISTFVLFCAISVLLWARLFAYQRYLIPFELLSGLIIWIQLSYLVSRRITRLAIIIALAGIFAWLIKVPDWGHAKTKFGNSNPFEMVMPKEISSQPARYLLFGVPVSYILPYLHPSSEFYGVGFSTQVNELIERKIQEKSNIPLGFLVRDSNALTALQHINRLGYRLPDYAFDCNYLRTGEGRYLSCLISNAQIQTAEANTIADIYFAEQSFHKSQGVIWETGLSHPEGWGRWSSDKAVVFGLTQCVPQGNIQVQLDAYSFAPVAGQMIYINLGSQEKSITLNSFPERRNLSFLNTESCVDRLTIKIPNTMSPSAAGLSTDSRSLGVAFVRIRVLRENAAD